MMKNIKIFLIILVVLVTIVIADNIVEAVARVYPPSRNANVGQRLYFSAETDRGDVNIIAWYVRVEGGGTGTYPRNDSMFEFTVGEEVRGRTLSVYFEYYLGSDYTTYYSDSATVYVNSGDNDITSGGEGCVNMNYTWPISLLALMGLFIFKRRSSSTNK